MNYHTHNDVVEIPELPMVQVLVASDYRGIRGPRLRSYVRYYELA